MANTLDGIAGERAARTFIKRVCRPSGVLLQADWLFEDNDRLYIVECKHQEHFEAPPFDGHGLPRHQVRARMYLWRKYDIRTMFLVFEKYMKGGYVQWLDILEERPEFIHDTHGRRPRRIYSLEAFDCIDDKLREVGMIR